MKIILHEKRVFWINKKKRRRSCLIMFSKTNFFCHCDLAAYLTVLHCLISMALAHVYFKHIRYISEILCW